MIAVEVATHAESFNCSACSHKNCDADGRRAGSNGPAAFERWEIKGVIRSKTCLLPMITDLSRECLSLYRHYKNGLLIHAGGLYEQPRKYIQAMGVIDAHQP